MAKQSDHLPETATIAKVIEKFISGLPARMQAVTEAYKRRDWQEIQALSHKMAGAALFGFPELGIAARNLEFAIKEQKFEQLPDLIQLLDKERLSAKENMVLCRK